MNGKYVFKVTAQEGNLRFIKVQIDNAVLEFEGAPRITGANPGKVVKLNFRIE